MSRTRGKSEENPAEFFRTPDWTTRAILRELGPHAPASVLEPGCGDGAILEVVAATWPTSSIYGIELDRERAEKARHWSAVCCCDFLTRDFDEPFSLAIGNPPFSLAIPFAERCFEAARETVLLMRLSMLEGLGRADWWRRYPADVYVIPRRPSFTGKGTDATAYAWFAWGPGRGGRWKVLDLTESEAA